MVMVEVVRHPLYMLTQNVRNFSGLIGTVRNFTIHYEYAGKPFPYFARGWESVFDTSNDVDKAIYYLQYMILRSQRMRVEFGARFPGQMLTVPFEEFVISPDGHMRALERALGTKITQHTKTMMKKQKVPRERYADSLDLSIYRRCGWEPPKKGFSERHEFQYRRDWAAERASPEAMQVFDNICNEYEEQFMNGALRNGESSYI